MGGWVRMWMWLSVGWVAAAIYPSIYLPPWPLQVQFISQIINQPTVCLSLSPSFPIHSQPTQRLPSPPTWQLFLARFCVLIGNKFKRAQTWPLPFDWENQQDDSANEKGGALQLNRA